MSSAHTGSASGQLEIEESSTGNGWAVRNVQMVEISTSIGEEGNKQEQFATSDLQSTGIND